MPKGESRRFVRARAGFVLAAEPGRSRGLAIKGGQVVEASNPIVRAHPDLFEPLQDEVVAAVEAAMQRPGEGRAVSTKKARSVLARLRAEEPEGEE